MFRNYRPRKALSLAVLCLFAIFLTALSCESGQSNSKSSAEKAKKPSSNCSTKAELVAKHPGKCIPVFLENAKPEVIAGFLRNEQLTRDILDKDVARDPQANKKAFLYSQRSDSVSLILVRSLPLGEFGDEFNSNLASRDQGDIIIYATPTGLTAAGGNSAELFDLFLYVKRGTELDLMKAEVVIDAGQTVGLSFVDKLGEGSVHYAYLMSHDGNLGVGGFYKRMAKTTHQKAKVERVIRLH